ncbi:hypothetical protein Leryth_004953 [Lithospermum erythrorhizon]|nr:hypothetical protein Leryth_004953 [Lithospermum erythrorhizon]
MLGSKVFDAESAMENEREKEVIALNETKAGTKGLFDAGIQKIPNIFIRSPEDIAEDLKRGRSCLQVPVIDLSGLVDGVDQRRVEVVGQLRRALEEWGIFQVVNHGVPPSVLDGMLAGIRQFHEQDVEMKKDLYSCDVKRKVRYSSNTELYYKAGAACWRDTLSISLQLTENVQPEELPTACRSTTVEFIKHATKLGEDLFRLLAEALGLEQDHLVGLDCAKGRQILCHYYPPCPEPELTLGANKHTDTSFISIVLQDQSGGLQALHNNKWVDVHPIPGALIVNLGDFFQIISNGKFKTVEHRVLSSQAGRPRISVACFFMGRIEPPTIYSPIHELISELNPLQYKEFTVEDYLVKFVARKRGKPVIHQFELNL